MLASSLHFSLREKLLCQFVIENANFFVMTLQNQHLSGQVWQKIFISKMCVTSVCSESSCQSLILHSKKNATSGFKALLGAREQQTVSQMYFFEQEIPLERGDIVVRFYFFP